MVLKKTLANYTWAIGVEHEMHIFLLNRNIVKHYNIIETENACRYILENWEILKRSEHHAVYRKTCTEYDIIDVSHKKTVEGQHIFYVSVPMITTKYAYSTSISGSQNMSNYMCTFIEHYSHARAHSQALDAYMRLSKL